MTSSASCPPRESEVPCESGTAPNLAILRSKIARFVRDNEERLRNADPAALAVDNDRAKDMWDPLLAFADVAGTGWPERARRAGQALAEAQDSDTAEADVRLVLLADIRDIFATEQAPPSDTLEPDMLDPDAGRGGRPDDGPRISSKRLIEKLVALEERPWSAWGRAKKPITGRSVGELFGPMASALARAQRRHAKGHREGVLSAILRRRICALSPYFRGFYPSHRHKPRKTRGK